MSEEKSEGVLIQAIPYLGRQRILKVFTPIHGLLSLMMKSPSPSWSAVTTPFCVGEWVYRRGQKELCLLKDASLIDGLFELKRNYEVLAAAGAIAQDLLRSQLPAKSAKDLYDLTLAYLKKLPAFSNPKILAASFRLKLLQHEGLLSLQESCASCRCPANYLAQGESFCAAHAPPGSFFFNLAEWEQLHCLAFSRQFSQLQEMKAVPAEKIDKIFQLIF